MRRAHGKRWIFFAAVIAGLLLVAALLFLRRNSLMANDASKAAPLTGYGAYSPVLIRGKVFFPVVSADGSIQYEKALDAQTLQGDPLIMSPSGTAPLPQDYRNGLYEAFGWVSYTRNSFKPYDTPYLLVVASDGTMAVCGVVLRHNEQFYLGNYDCELSETLLPDLMSALTSLGEK